ncbi:MAG: hypothetical protein ACRC62_30525 [Microcoleus sp.]
MSMRLNAINQQALDSARSQYAQQILQQCDRSTNLPTWSNGYDRFRGVHESVDAFGRVKVVQSVTNGTLREGDRLEVRGDFANAMPRVAEPQQVARRLPSTGQIVIAFSRATDPIEGEWWIGGHQRQPIKIVLENFGIGGMGNLRYISRLNGGQWVQAFQSNVGVEEGNVAQIGNSLGQSYKVSIAYPPPSQSTFEPTYEFSFLAPDFWEVRKVEKVDETSSPDLYVHTVEVAKTSQNLATGINANQASLSRVFLPGVRRFGTRPILDEPVIANLEKTHCLASRRVLVAEGDPGFPPTYDYSLILIDKNNQDYPINQDLLSSAIDLSQGLNFVGDRLYQVDLDTADEINGVPTIGGINADFSRGGSMKVKSFNPFTNWTSTIASKFFAIPSDAIIHHISFHP